jgi:hypothetical protein
MAKENLETLGEFKDGPLTGSNYSELMREIRRKKDYLDHSDYLSLFEQFEKEGPMAMTKYQFVQCQESAIFEASGVTRD